MVQYITCVKLNLITSVYFKEKSSYTHAKRDYMRLYEAFSFYLIFW